jgi:seryl-tRNA synthetase
MHDIKWIREHSDTFDRGLQRRGLAPLSGKLLALDETRRAAITKSEQAQARRNAASKEIGEAKKNKDGATRPPRKSAKPRRTRTMRAPRR